MKYKLLLAVTFFGVELAGGIHSGGGDGDPKLQMGTSAIIVACEACGGSVGLKSSDKKPLTKGNTNLSSGAGASS
ncbi:MAG: hypothetical protein R3C42_10010 [Parvularculaceae bacterium]